MRFFNFLCLKDFADTHINLIKLVDGYLLLNGVGLGLILGGLLCGLGCSGGVESLFVLGLRIREIKQLYVALLLNGKEEEIKAGALLLINKQSVNVLKEFTLYTL